MTDFEVHPIGTADRLKDLEAAAQGAFAAIGSLEAKLSIAQQGSLGRAYGALRAVLTPSAEVPLRAKR